jgi:DNA-binding NarL/FixJ family response regulator
MVSTGLSHLMSMAGLEAVGEVHDGDEVLDAIRRLEPDVLVLDLCIANGGDPLIRGASRLLPVLMLSGFWEPHNVSGALRTGARGYLTKAAPFERLAEAIRSVVKGQTFLDPEIGDPALLKLDERSPTDLTPRQREVFELVGRGWTDAQIAEHLKIRPLTAKTHVVQVMRKLGAHRRTELMVIAQREALEGRGLQFGAPQHARGGS